MENGLSNSGRQRFWENHIAQCKASGLSQSEYCRLNKISIKSFYYWKRRLKRCGVPTLVEVPLPKSFPIPSSCPQLCLVIGRYRIEMGRGFDAEDLERVVRTLGRI
jgi:hypothetical protein